MKKRLLSLLAIVAAMAFIAVPAWAADGDTDSGAVNFLLDNPQEITISTDAVNASSDVTLTDFSNGDGTRIATSWVVTSNNAFEIAFTGNSTADNGDPQDYPVFNKQDVDASGDTVGNSWDHMDTFFAVEIDGEQSVDGTDIWGTYSDPNKAASLLCSGDDEPRDVIKDIMTADLDGTATVKLKAEGQVPDAGVQSGSYDMDVTLTVTAHEQE